MVVAERVYMGLTLMMKSLPNSVTIRKGEILFLCVSCSERAFAGRVVSMANAGRNTNSSQVLHLVEGFFFTRNLFCLLLQFFITFKAVSHLDGKHTIFGVISGS